MPMRLKITIIFLALSMAVFGLFFGMGRLLLLPQLIVMDRDEGVKDLRRVEKRFARDAEQLRRVCVDYAQWSETIAYLKGDNPNYAQNNLTRDFFSNYKLNVVQVYDKNGRLALSDVRDDAAFKPLVVPKFSDRGLPPNHPLLNAAGDSRGGAGCMEIGDRLAWVASVPIRRNETDQVVGMMVFARFVNEAAVKRIRGDVDVDFAIKPYVEESSLSDAKRVWQSDASALYDDGKSKLVLYGRLADVSGKPVRWIVSQSPKNLAAAGRELLGNVELSVVLTTLILFGSAYWFCGRYVVAPVQKLIKHVQWIRQSGDYSKRVGEHHADEVGMLAEEFDMLLTNLHRSRDARVKAERRMRDILQDQIEMVVRFTPDGEITFVNPAFARCFGKPESAFIGRTIDSLVVGEDRDVLVKKVHELKGDELGPEFVLRAALFNGEVSPQEWRIRASRNQDGGLAEYQATARTIAGAAVTKTPVRPMPILDIGPMVGDFTPGPTT